jgi:predicted ribosomally synthesized peptide with SipW-like signal peptide
MNAMPDDFELSRRKALAALGTVGVASAGAGLGTSAYFSDQETFENNQLTAGTLDMGVGYTAHYSDWSDDEDAGLGGDVRMFEGGPDSVGTADDLQDGEVGLPANDAWLVAVDEGDVRTFLDNTLTGAYPNVGIESDPEQGVVECVDGEATPQADDATRPVIDLSDVKPGDFGEVTFDFALCDNPGYVWVTGALRSASENGTTEPEADDPDEGSGVELLDVVRAAIWVDDGGDGPGGDADGNDYQNGTEELLAVGSLREILGLEPGSAGTALNAALNGDIPAEEGGGAGRDCFSAETTHSVAFAWWVPVDHGNEIQGDSATFDLGLYTEQCRHNDGNGVDDDDRTATLSGRVLTVQPSQLADTLTPEGAFLLDDIPYDFEDFTSPASNATVGVGERRVTTDAEGEFSIAVPSGRNLEMNVGGLVDYQRMETSVVVEQDVEERTILLFPVGFGGLGETVQRISTNEVDHLRGLLDDLVHRTPLADEDVLDADGTEVLATATEMFGSERRIVTAGNPDRGFLGLMSPTPLLGIYAGFLFDGTNAAFYEVDTSGSETQHRLLRYNDSYRISDGGASDIIPPNRFLPRENPPPGGLSRQDVIDSLQDSAGLPPIYISTYGATFPSDPVPFAAATTNGQEGADVTDVWPRRKDHEAFQNCFGKELLEANLTSTFWWILAGIGIVVLGSLLTAWFTGPYGPAISAVAGIGTTAIGGLLSAAENFDDALCRCYVRVYCEQITSDLSRCNCPNVPPEPPCPAIAQSYVNMVEAINTCIDRGELEGWGDGQLEDDACEVRDEPEDCEQYQGAN